MTAAFALDGPLPESDLSLSGHDVPIPVEQPARTSLAELRTDRLSYMADMIDELQVMAHETQCHTLAGILRLAHSEARQQIHGRAP